MRRLALVLATLTLAPAPPALAQPPGVEHFRGQVVSISADTLVIKGLHGQPRSIALSPSWGVTLARPVDASVIQPGDFVGVTEVEKPGGATMTGI